MSVVLTGLEQAVVDAERAFAPVLGSLIRSDDPAYIACLLAVSNLRAELRPEVRQAHPAPLNMPSDRDWLLANASAEARDVVDMIPDADCSALAATARIRLERRGGIDMPAR